MGGALGDTYGLKPGVNPINTEITFDHLVRHMIELGNTPRAGTGAGHATYAFLLIQHHDAILTFGNGTGRTDIGAIGFVTLIAASKGKLCLWHATDRFERIMVDLAENRAKGQFFVYLAVDLAGMAPDAPFGIEINHIFVHNSTLLFGFRALRRTVTKLSHRFMPPPALSQLSSMPTISF